MLRRSIYAKTRQQATQALRGALKARDDGAPLPMGRITLEEFLLAWFSGAAPSLRSTSVTRWRISEPKTHNSRRRVPLGPLGLAALRRHRLSQSAERLRAEA